MLFHKAVWDSWRVPRRRSVFESENESGPMALPLECCMAVVSSSGTAHRLFTHFAVEM